MPIFTPEELELIRQRRRTEGGAMPPSSVNEATSEEGIEKDVMNRILNPDGGLDLATKRAMKSNEGNPSFQIPASGIKSREMQMAENSTRSPSFLRSVMAGIAVDTPRQFADKWRYEQDLQDAVDAGMFGDPGKIRYLEQQGYSLRKIAEMTPEQRARELHATGGGDLAVQLGPEKNYDSFKDMGNRGVLPVELNRKLFGAEDSLVGGFFDRVADNAEVDLAQRQPDGTLGKFAHAVARSVPNMLIRRFPEIAMRAALGDGSALVTALYSGISEAGSEGGSTYREAKESMGKKEALQSAMRTQELNEKILGLSNTGQAALANRYMPKLMDTLKKGGKESYGKVFDFILDSVIQGGEEVAQGVVSNTSLGKPLDMGELAFEGIVGAGASMLTAGLGAGYAKGFESYSARRAAGDARDDWYPKFKEWVNMKNNSEVYPVSGNVDENGNQKTLEDIPATVPYGGSPDNPGYMTPVDYKTHHEFAIVLPDGAYFFIPKVDTDGKIITKTKAMNMATHRLEFKGIPDGDSKAKKAGSWRSELNKEDVPDKRKYNLIPFKRRDARTGESVFKSGMPINKQNVETEDQQRKRLLKRFGVTRGAFADARSTLYTIDDAMAHFGINKDSFDPKKITKVPINKTHAWVRMFAEQEARKNASDKDIENARLDGQNKNLREAAAASKAGSGITVEKPDATSGKKPVAYDRVTQDDISDAGSLEQFAGFVFDPKAMSGADDATRSKAILMAKDFYMNNSGKWNTDSSYGMDAVRGLYSSVYDMMPQSVKNRYSKDSFIKANFLWAEHSAAESELQKVVRKKADEKREAVVSNPDVDPEVAKATEEVIQQIVERDKNQDELGTGELKPDIKAAYRDTPSTDDIHLSDIDANKVIDEAIGKSDRLTEDSTAVEVADTVLGLEDGWLASLLGNADLNERQAGELERAVDHLNEIAILMEKKKVSPETIQKVIDTVRERVKASVEANANMWAVDKDDPTYADKEFAAIVSAVGGKYDISEPLMRTIAKRMDELYRKANDIKKSTTGRFIREHGGNIISKGVNRANSDTAKALLEIERLTRIIERNDSMDPDAETDAKFRIEKLKERLHELSTTSDMVAYIVNEMPKWKKPKPANNFPQGITTAAIQKAIDHFNSHGDQGKGVADTLLNMWYADAESNENYNAAMSKMREQRKVNALSDQADQVFYNAAEEAEKRANSKRGKGMEVRGVSVAAFLQELEDVYVDAVASGNGKEFLLNLLDNMENWKGKLGDTNAEAKTLASEMFDLYNALNLKSIPDLENTKGKVVVPLKEFHRNFPNVQSLRRMENAINDVRAWGEAQAATREEKANLLKEVVNLEQDKGIDAAATEEVFGTPAEQQETSLAEPGDTIYDTFPVGIVAGQQVATAPSSARTGLGGKIASVLLRANAKTPDAFNTVHDRMRKFINGKETIISHALDRIFDMAEKIPEIRTQVANIFNYSIGSGVSLASVDESVREDLQNVLTALDEVTRVRKDNGMTGGPKKSSDLVRSINHDMRDNPDFVPDPKALADFAIGAMKDGKAMSFEEGLALAHKVLNRDAYGDFRLDQMPKYMQDLLGYSPDPLVQLYMNSRKLVRDTARQLFEKNLLDDTKVVADTQLEPDYVRLVSDENAKYYSLEGKWVPPEVASVLQQDQKARNELMRGYLMIHSMFKQMKIIYSTTSYVNNFFGNFFLMQMGGVPLHESVKRYPKAAKEVFNWITGGKISAGLKEAIDNGLFDNTMTSSELALSSSNMEALSKLKGDDFGKVNGVLFSALNKLENNKAGKFGRTLYEGIEQVHRYIAYRYFRDVGYTQDVNRKGLDPSAPVATMALNLNPFRKKIPMSAAQAVAQVDKTLFNYRDLPTGVKALRDTGIPFISFPYLAGRSFLRNMTENPLGIISMVLTGMLLREAVRALTRGRKELELEGWIPYWEVIDPLQRSNKRWGEDWLDAIKGNFTPGGPMMMIPEIVRGKKFFGDIPISERRDREPTDGEIGRHVWDTMGPSVLVSGLRNVESVQKGKDSVGNRIFRQFGIRLRDSDRGALRKDLNRLNMKIREQQREYNRGNITYGDMMENIGKIRNAADGLRKDFGSPFGVGP